MGMRYGIMFPSQGWIIMIDIEYLNKIKLVPQPLGQKIVAHLLLLPNYHIFQKVDIRIENAERIPRKTFNRRMDKGLHRAVKDMIEGAYF
jgi:hypothetical protein